MLEDRIIFNLFDRSHYKRNGAIYVPEESRFSGIKCSYFEFILRYLQEGNAKAGRFQIPGEVPFFEDLPEPIVHREQSELPLGPTEINLNKRILDIYMQAIGRMCEDGDDGEYGSAAMADAQVVDSISTRVHRGGLSIADIKYSQEKEAFDALVREGDETGIMEKISNPEQEERVLQRVGEKGERYGINPAFITDFYRGEVIPLTKDAEVLRIIEVARNLN
jgi:chorismate mutase